MRASPSPRSARQQSHALMSAVTCRDVDEKLIGASQIPAPNNPKLRGTAGAVHGAAGDEKLGGEDGAAEGCCRLRECARPEAVRARGYDVLIAVVRSPWPVAARRKHHGAAA